MDNPGSKPPLIGDEVTDSSMEVVLKNPFNEDDGEIQYYSIIITSDIEEEISEPPPKWSDVQKGERKGHAAIYKCVSLFGNSDGCWDENKRVKRKTNGVSSTLNLYTYIMVGCRPFKSHEYILNYNTYNSG